MTDLTLLRPLQLSDSQFPIGAFAHSNGLESYAQQGLDPDGLLELLTSQLDCGWGRLDLAAVALAWQADDVATLERLGAEVQAWKVVPGLRQTSLRLGSRLLTLAARLFPEAAADLALERSHQAVAVGALARCLGIAQPAALLAFGHGTLLSTLMAATRCLPLSPERVQELLIALQPKLAEAVEWVLHDPAASMFSATPAADLRAHQQACLHTRLFQS